MSLAILENSFSAIDYISFAEKLLVIIEWNTRPPPPMDPPLLMRKKFCGLVFNWEALTLMNLINNLFPVFVND